ncbi:MAG: hypothetical protein RLZZ218_431 [Actinomycetota bacterium]|jgi:hypothetical protein
MQLVSSLLLTKLLLTALTEGLLEPDLELSVFLINPDV